MAKPRLRFSEFSSEWSELALGDIVTENIEPIPMPKTGYTRVGIYCHAKGTFQEYVPEGKGLDVDVMYVVHKDNLIVNITFAWEHAIAITKTEDEGKIVSHRFPTYRFNEGHLPEFYRYLILDKRMEYHLMVASPGGAGRNRVLNKTEFLKIPVNVPDIREQKKIADVISSVDDVISLIESEVALWEEKKKGVMQKIFSQEVRFKKGDDSEYPDWKRKKLEEVVVFLDGRRKPLEGKQRVSGIYPYYGASGIIDYVEDYLFDEENILLSEDGANIVSRTYRVSFLARGKYWVNNHAHVLHPQNNNNAVFICEQLENIDYGKYNSGSAQPKLNQEVCKKIPIMMPCIEEQQKIADCLSSVDAVIEIKKEKLATWKNLKKGLLQQMFV